MHRLRRKLFVGTPLEGDLRAFEALFLSGKLVELLRSVAVLYRSVACVVPFTVTSSWLWDLLFSAYV